MIAIDANLLLYAYDVTAVQHERARRWLEETFSSAPLVGLPLVSILAFVRIATDRRVSENPRTPAQASAIVGAWAARDNVCILEPGPNHWQIFSAMLVDSNCSGPRITDAHLAALAVEHGATFYTNDRDFRRFRNLAVRFPLLDDASALNE